MAFLVGFLIAQDDNTSHICSGTGSRRVNVEDILSAGVDLELGVWISRGLVA